MDMIEISSVNGKKIRISKDVNYIAQPGFGTVRAGEYDGNPCLVKWFPGKSWRGWDVGGSCMRT